MDELSPPLVGPTREGLCFDCPSVLIAASAHPRLRDTARFVTAAGERHVICALAPPSNLRSRVWRVRADLLGMPHGDWVVTAVRNDEGLDPLTLTPESFCPIAGAVQSFRDLANSLTRASLRQFLADSFADFRVFEDFWQAQAGPDHHHWPGGLAVHTLEVARTVSQTFDGPASDGKPWKREERDIGITAALTHDIGECVDNGRPLDEPHELQRQIMEMRHLELIHDAVSSLHNRDRPVARALLALMYPRQRFPPSNFRVEAVRAALLCAQRASVAGTRASPK